jgi:DNA-binding NarL/FixJ family response regulator
MVNIVIADHQAIFRAGIAKILAVEEDLRVVGQPSSIEQLMNCLEKLRAKLLVISSGFAQDLAEILAVARHHQVAVLLLAENSDDPDKHMRARMQGVAFRSIPGDSMVEAVRRLARGETFVQAGSPEARPCGEDDVGLRVRDRLSDKELKIMAAVVRGFKNREIALQMYTSEQVIKNALRNIFDKTGVSDRLELALFVLHHRILAQATAAVQLHNEQRRKRSLDMSSRASQSGKRLPPGIH